MRCQRLPQSIVIHIGVQPKSQALQPCDSPATASCSCHAAELSCWQQEPSCPHCSLCAGHDKKKQLLLLAGKEAYVVSRVIFSMTTVCAARCQAQQSFASAIQLELLQTTICLRLTSSSHCTEQAPGELCLPSPRQPHLILSSLHLDKVGKPLKSAASIQDADFIVPC